MNTSPNAKHRLLSATLLAAAFISPAIAEETKDTKEPSTLKEALASSKPIFNFRTRYEYVDQDGLPETANALTYRIRAGLETGEFAKTKVLLEFEHVQDVVDDYRSPAGPNNPGYPVVADQNTTELNRFQLVNTAIPDTKITLGRQIIALDDHRFIGHVGWRQDIQTYDALRVTNTSIKNLTIDAGYINQVNRIFPDDFGGGQWDGDSYFANVSYKTPVGKLTGFAYLIDTDPAPANSTETLGVRFAGAKDVGPGKFGYIASYAQQTEFGSSNLDYEADYYLVDVNYKIDKFKAGLGYEVLGADEDAGTAFKTPFATLHKFQGWTDKFLGTPATGIQDAYISANYLPGELGPFKGVKFGVVYHDFTSDVSSLDYGSETEIIAGAKWDVLAFTVKAAKYSADEFASDTTKFWFQVDYAF